MAQRLSITKRGGALIGGSIVNRTQMHGKKEKVPAVSIPIGGIVLTPEEFCALMRDPHAYEAFFTNERSAVMEPRFTGMTEIPIDDVFEGAKVTIAPQDTDKPLILKPAKIGSIVITPVGSQPIMKCMVSGAPDIHLETLTLLNKKCTISVLNGALAEKDDRQKELPLPGGGPEVGVETDGEVKNITLADVEREEDEATRHATDAPESRISRQIRLSELKSKRASKKK
jgi:hypothetical protein